VLVGWAEFESSAIRPISHFAIFFAILIGGVTFTGSFVAYLKLSGKMSGRPTLFPGQKAINAVIFPPSSFCGCCIVAQAAWALYAIIASGIPSRRARGAADRRRRHAGRHRLPQQLLRSRRIRRRVSSS
jgi:hypothetical protein